jgi:hypothetical protein
VANYVNVTQQEIEDFLLPQGFQLVLLDSAHEYVYGKRVDAHGLPLTLRVFTGITPDGSRGVGEDAIRCVIFWKNMSDGSVKKVASSKRVHRVAGWRNNLQQRIDSLTIEYQCDKCGAPMVKRKSKRGEFYGCGNYPDCRNTKEA